MDRRHTTLKVDGYEVTASFAPHKNDIVCGHVKHILLSAFACRSKEKEPVGILAMPSAQRYNNSGDDPYAP